jgi:hypothetical protein
MDVSEARRPKALEDENAKLKKLLAKQMLEAAALRELLRTTRPNNKKQALAKTDEARAPVLPGRVTGSG